MSVRGRNGTHRDACAPSEDRDGAPSYMGSSSRAGLGENAKPADQDAASARQTNDAAVPMKGVALWALREFVDKHRDRLEQGPMSTGDVGSLLVKPATHAAACAYIELLEAEDRQKNLEGKRPSRTRRAAVGPASLFLSHAWKSPFLSLVAAAEAHLRQRFETREEAEEQFVWLDIFVLCQHDETCAAAKCACGSKQKAMDETWLSGAFCTAIRGFKHVLSVLDPWENPMPFTRSWCLWELLCAIEGAEVGVKLDVAVPPLQEAEFLHSLVEDFERIQARVSAINCRTATAFKEHETDMIRRAVEATAGGFEGVNRAVISRMRSWLADSGLRALQRLPAGHERATSALQYAVAVLLEEEEGRAPEAEALHRETLAAQTTAHGGDHLLTQMSANNLANLLGETGRSAEAESLYRQVLNARRKTLGNRHESTLLSLNNLAAQLLCIGKSNEAELLHWEALAASREIYGNLHLQTIVLLANMGANQIRVGKYAEAEALLREASEGFNAVIGGRHLHTIKCFGSLASVLTELGRYADAEAIFLKMLSASRETNGVTHAITLSLAINYVILLKEIGGRSAQAEELCREVLAARRETLGDHESTFNTLAVLAAVLRGAGRFAEAEPLFREALAGLRRALGDESSRQPMILMVCNDLAELLEVTGRPSEAEPLYQEALAGRRETLGWHHPHTLVTVGGYARLLCVRWRCGGRVDAALADEAAALLRERVEGLRARARGVVNSSSGTETAAATRSNTHEGGGDDKENGDGSTSSGQHGPHGGGGKDAAGGSAAAAAAERLLAEFLRESGRRALGD